MNSTLTTEDAKARLEELTRKVFISHFETKKIFRIQVMFNLQIRIYCSDQRTATEKLSEYFSKVYFSLY